MKIVAFTKRNHDKLDRMDTEFKVFHTDEGLQEFVDTKVARGFSVHLFTYSESFRLNSELTHYKINNS